MKHSDYVRIRSVNPSYLIISKSMEILEKKMEVNTQFLIQQSFTLEIKAKKYLKKYTELWDGIKNETETINESKEGDMVKIL